MSRPENITEEDIARWNEAFDNAPAPIRELIEKLSSEDRDLKELMYYPGAWLIEQLEKESCPDIMITMIVALAGEESGKDIENAWEIVQSYLLDYKQAFANVQNMPKRSKAEDVDDNPPDTLSGGIFEKLD